MEERREITNDVSNTNIAIEITNGTFAWDQVDLPNETGKGKLDKKKFLKENDAAIYKKTGLILVYFNQFKLSYPQYQNFSEYLG